MDEYLYEQFIIETQQIFVELYLNFTVVVVRGMLIMSE